MIDLVEIGAGGGSIAWVDSGGGVAGRAAQRRSRSGTGQLRRGGEQPTITDANLVLGRLNPDFFLGGEIPLDPERAEQAIA